MAKRKKKSTSRRRRRVGAMALSASNPLVKFGIPVIGYLMGDKINAPILKMVGDKVDGKIIGAGEALAGYLILTKGKKSLPMSIIGGLLVGAGIKKTMAEFGIGGIGNVYGRVPVIGNTYGRVPVIGNRMGAYTPNQALNGYTPNQSLNRVMAGTSTGTGSGLTSQPGSNLMN